MKEEGCGKRRYQCSENEVSLLLKELLLLLLLLLPR
jgi:hypothetical protein